MTTHARLCRILDSNIQICTDMAVIEVERLARRTMERNGRCTSFIMGMGSASFYDKHGTPIDYDEAKYLKPFYDFLDTYDRYLYLTGIPMKIEGHDGELIKDW